MQTHRTAENVMRMTALAAMMTAALACTRSGNAATASGAHQTSNMEVARRFVEGFLGGKNPAAVDEVTHENIKVYTGLKPDGPIDGRKQYKEVFDGFMKAFPDVKLEIEDMFAAGRSSVVRFKAVGAHKASCSGSSPPTRLTLQGPSAAAGRRAASWRTGGRPQPRVRDALAPVLGR